MKIDFQIIIRSIIVLCILIVTIFIMPMQIQTDSENKNILESNIPESNILESSIPESNILESSIPENNIFKGNIYKGNIYKGNTYKGNILEGNTLEGITLEGNILKGYTLEGNILEDIILESNTLGGNTPEGNTQEGNTPGGNTPEGNILESNTPEGNTPEGNTPEGNTLVSNILANNNLADYERVVTSYDELKDALANNNGITTVYFGSDITMKASGIIIHTSKANVVISGLNPLNPDQTVPYTLTDHTSTSFYDTIYVNSSGVKSLLISDLNIVGKNYYGSFSVSETNLTDGLIITYQRVSYSGPQIGHHRRGTLRFIDCTVSINGKNGGSDSNEFAEVKNLIFEGKNTIDTVTGTNGVFWHIGGGTFEIADNSSLTVTALNLGSAFGMYYADGAGVSISIGKGSVYKIKTAESVNFYAQAIIKSLTVNENGLFSLESTKETTYAVMSMGGSISVGENASFIMNGYGSSTYALLAQRAGNITISKNAAFHLVAKKNFPALLSLYGSSLLCNDPASVLLYNISSPCIKSITTAGKLYVEAEQINYWEKAGTGGLNDLAKFRWKKADGSNFIVNGTISATGDGDFSSLTSNYIVGDLPGSAPTAANFRMSLARVLSFGRLDLTIHELSETSAAVTGITAPGTAVRVSYTQDMTKYVLPDTSANSDGFYYAPLNTPLVRDTIVTVMGCYNFLTAVTSVSVIPANNVYKLEMTVPEYLMFDPIGLNSMAQYARRMDTDWNITITDTRGQGSGWKLYVRVPVPLTLQDSSGLILEDALVFVDDTGTAIPLDTNGLLPISQHIAISGNDITIINWEENRGVLVYILPENVIAGNYTGSIEWILADTP